MPQSNTQVFSSLEIDLNESKTLLQISSRVEILTKLLGTYLNEGISSVKVPLGKVFVLIEMICSINMRYLSFKSDVRDPEIKGLIKKTLYLNYQSALGLLKSLLVFKGSLIPHISSLWSSLAYIIPLSKSGKVSSTDVLNNEALFTDLLNCVSDYLQLIGAFADNTLLVPFVDVALSLSEPRSAPAKPKGQPIPTSQQKKTKKKNVSSAPLSDILSHEHLFTQSRSKHLLHVVRTFIDQVIKRSELPPTQHYKVVKVVIQECVEAAAGNYESAVPDSFRALLRSTVLNPGYDKHNVLPIVSSIIPNDELLSVFNNPRLPPLPKHVTVFKEQEEQDADFENVSEPEVEAQVSSKESAILKLLDEQNNKREKIVLNLESTNVSTSTEFSVKRVVNDVVSENYSDKKRKVEAVQADFSFKPESLKNDSAPIEENPKEPVVETESHTAASSTVYDNADEPDFEMPEINMEEDSEDEDDE